MLFILQKVEVHKFLLQPGAAALNNVGSIYNF